MPISRGDPRSAGFSRHGRPASAGRGGGLGLLPILLFICVPAFAAEVDIHVLGQAILDTSKARQVNAPAKDLVIERVAPYGSMVKPGDVVIAFDPSVIAGNIDDLRRAAAIAKLDMARWRAGRDAALAALESERRRLRADLAATRAAIAALEAPDPERIALLDAERRQALLKADLAARDAGRTAEDRALGLVSEAALERARLDAVLARSEVAAPELAWRLAAHPEGEAIELALLRVHERDLALQVGFGADGKESPVLGIGARLAAAAAQVEADQGSKRADLDRAESELRQAERDAGDRTPLVSVEVRPAAGGDPVARIRFAPDGNEVPEGWTADRGTPFDPATGRGWSRALSAEELVWRMAGAAPPSAGNGQRRGGGGGGGGRRRDNGAQARPSKVLFSGGVAVLATPATWSLALPAGSYALVMTLGDDRDWDGAVLRAEGVPVQLPERLGPGPAEFKATVEVGDGRLDIELGDGVPKARRATAAGVVVHQPSAYPGFRVDDPSQTLSSLVDPAAFIIDARLPQELAPAVARGSAPAPASGGVLDRLTLVGAELVRSDGERLPAAVTSVGAQGVPWTRGWHDWDDGNPADNNVRELHLLPVEASRGRIACGESVDVVLRLAFPAGMTALPPHLVRLDPDGATIRVDGKQRTLPGARVGEVVVVDAVIDAARCSAPGEREDIAAEVAAGRFRGEVTPGKRTRVAAHWVWGRVESLVADGSQVKADDVVLTVYNPQMDADRERQERERLASVQNIAAAVERRRQAQLVANGEHRARVAAETEARVRLRRHLDADPLQRAQFAATLERTRREGEAAAVALKRQRQLTTPDPDDLAAAEDAVGRSAIAADRTALDAAQLELAADWFTGLDLAAAWTDRVQALSRREAEIAEAGLQERIDAVGDRIALDRAQEGDWWQRNFALRRFIKTPVGGRILFLKGWNDQGWKVEKIGKEFPVWAGMSVADIVDESTLGFTAELPEDRFPGLEPGRKCELELADAPGRTIAGTLTEIGLAFTLPKDRQGGDDADAVTSRRVFRVTASFTPPEDLRGRLETGAKGWMRIP